MRHDRDRILQVNDTVPVDVLRAVFMQTRCTRLAFSFHPLSRRQIVAGYDGGLSTAIIILVGREPAFGLGATWISRPSSHGRRP